MLTSPSALGAFYPAYCFPLSLTYDTWAKLTAIDVHRLHERPGFEGQNLYFHLNHPIKWVRLVGVVVAIDIYPTRWILLLDDSSGATLEVTCGRPTSTGKQTESTLALEGASQWKLPDVPTQGLTATGRSIDMSGVDIGTVIKVKGGLGSFREEKQILLERISLLHTTNEEATAWAEATAFRKEVLSVPWVVSEQEQERARRKAEGFDRERRRREERKKKQKAKTGLERTRKAESSNHVTAEQERKTDVEGSRAAAEKEKREQARIKRMKERKYRELEHENLSRKANVRPSLDDAPVLVEEIERVIEDQQASAENLAQQREENLCAAAQLTKKEQGKKRRDEERLLRTQEFERLKRLKNGQEKG